MKGELLRNWITKTAALLLRGSFKRLKKKFDYSEYGGAPLLGVNGVSIICHGRSNPVAIKNAIKVAAHFYENRANERIHDRIADLYRQHII